MTALDALSLQLLIGTDRRAPEWPAASGELGRFVSQIAGTEDAVEIRALRIAGVLAVCTRAGYQPAPTDQAPLPRCPEEQCAPVIEPELLSTLQRVLEEGPDPLRAEALRRLAGASRLLPAALLPLALTLGVKQAGLRAPLSAVLGERGRWLAQLNPRWSAAVLADASGVDPRWWEEGTLEQRCQCLAALRRHDPAAARQRLIETFPETDARGRARLLAMLEIGLGGDDEDCLNDCLTDRSKEVRQQAAELLATLPESGYVVRMAERLRTCLSEQRVRLNTRLSIEPPETFDPDWKADALIDSPPRGESLGLRAWWLYQLARAVPLSWWSSATGMTAQEWIRWAKKSDWELALLRAWSEALARAPSPEWSSALLSRLPVKDLVLDALDVIASLPPAERELAWVAQIEASKRGSNLGATLSRIARTLSEEGTALSPPVARTLIAQLKRSIATARLSHDVVLRRSLAEFICCLPADTLGEAAAEWLIEHEHSPSVAETLARVQDVIQHRQTLIHHLQDA